MKNPPIYGANIFNGTICNNARWNKKSEIQYGRHQTGSTHNSASRLDSNAISTANSMFLKSSDTEDTVQHKGYWNIQETGISKRAVVKWQQKESSGGISTPPPWLYEG